VFTRRAKSPLFEAEAIAQTLRGLGVDERAVALEEVGTADLHELKAAAKVNCELFDTVKGGLSADTELEVAGAAWSDGLHEAERTGGTLGLDVKRPGTGN
jgi:hypothetical protein